MRVLPALRPASVVCAALVLCVPLIGATTTPAATAERDGPLPRLERIGPTEPPPARDTLELSPAVVEVVAPPDRRREVRHVVANGLEVPLDLDIEVVAAATGPDGPYLLDDPPPASAPGRLVAPTDRLSLAPGEGAALISTVEVDAGQAVLLAVRATAAEGSDAAAYVVVSAQDLPASPHLDLTMAADGRVDLVLGAARPAVVDMRIRSRSWLATTNDETLAGLVVGPEPRRLTTDVGATRWPGPVSAAVTVAGADGDPVAATAGRWVLPRELLAVLAALLIALVVVALRHRGGAARAAVGSSGDRAAESGAAEGGDRAASDPSDRAPQEPDDGS